jgi:hypothetical protein
VKLYGGRLGGSNTQSTRNKHPTCKYSFFLFRTRTSRRLGIIIIIFPFSGYHLVTSRRLDPQAILTFVATANARPVPNTNPLKSQALSIASCVQIYLITIAITPQSVVYATFQFKGDPLRISFPLTATYDARVCFVVRAGWKFVLWFGCGVA